jgi:hypothetical protein
VNTKRLLIPVLAGALIVATAATALAAASSQPTGRARRAAASPTRPHLVVPHRLRREKRVNGVLVRRLRGTVWRWQSVIGVRRAQSIAAPLHTARALHYWRVQERRVVRLAAHPPHKSAWLCIHRYEGSWADGRDPYWGGLQMDRGFMSTYAARVLLHKGWANRWTPLEQMWVAERALRSGRGFWPWPNTARACGLL